MDSWHPARLCSGQRMTPHRWPATVSSTLQLAASASRSAASTSGLGCLARMVLTMYNTYEERSTTPRPTTHASRRRATWTRSAVARSGARRLPARHAGQPRLHGGCAQASSTRSTTRAWRRPCGDRTACASTATTTPLGRSERPRRSCRDCGGGAQAPVAVLGIRAGRTSRPAGNLAPRSRPA
jgi:hypothetical protein